ncbi:MAG: hypothetical protein H6603_10250 [Flavobacteriales bacterium]|nr:hypothetical protein [Flavobacteriales bacterium]
MRKTVLTFLLLAAINVFALPQEVQQAISSIGSNMRTIRAVQGTINQRVSLHKGTIADFDITTTDPKGRVSTEQYRIDLADIDPMMLTSGVERNMMKVEVHTVLKQRYITELRAGEVTGYGTRFKIDVEDMDNARQLMDALKEAIDIARAQNDYTLQFGSLDEVLMELSSLITPTGDVSEQRLLLNSSQPEKPTHLVRKGSGAAIKHEFNLKDLNATTVDYQAHGRNLSIKLATYGGTKAVKRYENDLAKDFVPAFTVDAETVDQAKKIKALFELAIRMANGETVQRPSNKPVRTQTTASSSSSNVSASTKNSESQNRGVNPNVELAKDPESGKYSWAGVYEIPGHSAEELYAVMNSIIPNKKVISRIDNSQIVFQCMGGNGTALRLAGDAFLSMTIKVGFKDGKVRMHVTDIFYDNRAWGFSAPQTLEAMDGKKLNKVVGDINERLTNAFRADVDALKKKIRLTEQEDW